MNRTTSFFKRLATLGLMICTFSGVVQANDVEKPHGFLWYNLPKEQKKPQKTEKKIAWSKLSYQQRNKVLHYYTMEALNKAITTHKVEDVIEFIELKQYWERQANIFQHNFNIALLKRPDLDFTVNHPVSAIGTKLNQARYTQKANRMINELTHEYGLLFFYKGTDVYSQKQAPVLTSFAMRHQFNFIPVSVDGQVIPSLPNTKVDSGQAKRLNINHFPAIVLVHPTKGQVLPVSHGFITQDYLQEQMMVVALELKKQQLGEGVLND